MGDANEAVADGEPWCVRDDQRRALQRSRWWRRFRRSFRREGLMFKRPSLRYGRTPAPETPYQKAAQVWDERIGSARGQARNLRVMAVGSVPLLPGPPSRA